MSRKNKGRFSREKAGIFQETFLSVYKTPQDGINRMLTI